MLQNGDQAPDFTVKDHQGHTRTLSAFQGKKVLLYFYPKADTPGCTTQGCGFRDKIQETDNKGVQILGVSFDTVAENANFAQKFSFPFPLLCDTDRKIGLAYGACDDDKAQYAKRIAYLIGSDGKVEHVWPKADPSQHVQQLLALL